MHGFSPTRQELQLKVAQHDQPRQTGCRSTSTQVGGSPLALGRLSLQLLERHALGLLLHLARRCVHAARARGTGRR